MRFLHDDPNPLNVLEIRELDYLPSNWEKVDLNIQNHWRIQYNLDEIRKWIYNNLQGRFCVVSDTGIIDNKMEIVYKIGFEIPGEATMFSLGCSVLHERGPLF